MQEVLMILLIAAPAAAAGWFGRARWTGTGADAAALDAENVRLTAQIGGMQERIAVLERIAVDPGVQTAREIAALR